MGRGGDTEDSIKSRLSEDVLLRPLPLPLSLDLLVLGGGDELTLPVDVLVGLHGAVDDATMSSSLQDILTFLSFSI